MDPQAGPVPETGLRWPAVQRLIYSHVEALRDLGLLYRRPEELRSKVQPLLAAQQLVFGLRLWYNLVPYVLLPVVLVHLSVFGWPLLPLPTDVVGRVVEAAALGLAAGLALGLAAATAAGRAFGAALALALGFTFAGAFAVLQGLDGLLEEGIGEGIVLGLFFGVAESIAFATVRGLSLGVAESLLGAALVGSSTGVAEGVAFGAANLVAYLRLYYHPLQPLFILPVPRVGRYRHHPVAWDDLCRLPFPGLDGLLVALFEHDSAAGAVEIERLIAHYPSQARAALRAKATVIARRSARESDLSRLEETLSRLPEGQWGYLSDTRRLRGLVSEIATLQTRLNTARPFLRETIAQLLCKEIESFEHRVSGFREPLASEFRAAAAEWQKIAARQLEEARAVLSRESTPQVFRAGDPVDREREAFVPRFDLLEELEQQIMLSAGCPGLVLYGRRRTGKSTILLNLKGFLPPGVLSVVVSMQHPQAFTSTGAFIAHLMRKASAAPTLARVGRAPANLTGLSSFLADCNGMLDDNGGRLLFALDEYENLDERIGLGVISIDLLAALRDSVQSHRRLTWVFAGSHEITELRHAPWASYLVSLRTIEVAPFSLNETRLVLTEPLQHSALWRRDAPDRPRFSPEFWGGDENGSGIERIHREAGGWPHLVQLIAETAVDLVNDDAKAVLTPALLERAFDRAMVRGQIVLSELMEGECSQPGEWEYLSRFRNRMLQPRPADPAVVRSLRRRLLVEEVGEEFRLRVPLMARWLRRYR